MTVQKHGNTLLPQDGSPGRPVATLTWGPQHFHPPPGRSCQPGFEVGPREESSQKNKSHFPQPQPSPLPGVSYTKLTLSLPSHFLSHAATSCKQLTHPGLPIYHRKDTRTLHFPFLTCCGLQQAKETGSQQPGPSCRPPGPLCIPSHTHPCADSMSTHPSSWSEAWIQDETKGALASWGSQCPMPVRATLEHSTEKWL